MKSSFCIDLQRFMLIHTKFPLTQKKGDYLKAKKEKSYKSFDIQDFVAEREGFEPPVPLSTPVFKTGAFDHSAISP